MLCEMSWWQYDFQDGKLCTAQEKHKSVAILNMHKSIDENFIWYGNDKTS